MAHYDKRHGIVLDIEDKEMFQEISSRFGQGGIKTLWSNSIMKSILKLLEEINKQKNG